MDKNTIIKYAVGKSIKVREYSPNSNIFIRLCSCNPFFCKKMSNEDNKIYPVDKNNFTKEIFNKSLKKAVFFNDIISALNYSIKKRKVNRDNIIMKERPVFKVLVSKKEPNKIIKVLTIDFNTY